jgi:glycosyltransferase involved in cell wall biosynthesis
VVEVLAVSRAAKGKALDLVVEAVTRLEDVRLTVVGDGPELASLRSLAAGSKRITFVGAAHPEEVLARYESSDVFVFPSQYDLFGLVLVEAMGAGLPVITSDAPGAVADLAVDGSNCVLVREPTSVAWEAALRRVAESPDLRLGLGARAGATIARRWTIQHAAESMLAALRLAVLARDEVSR